MNERRNELMKGQRSRIKLRFGSAFLLLIVVDVTFHSLATCTNEHVLEYSTSIVGSFFQGHHNDEPWKKRENGKSTIVIPAVARGNEKIVVVREKKKKKTDNRFSRFTHQTELSTPPPLSPPSSIFLGPCPRPDLSMMQVSIPRPCSSLRYKFDYGYSRVDSQGRFYDSLNRRYCTVTYDNLYCILCVVYYTVRVLVP